MCLAGHPSKFIEFVMAEKSSKDDGLSHRFLICSPLPQFLTKEAIQMAKSKTPFSLTNLLYDIQNVMGKGLVFKLEGEAEKVLISSTRIVDSLGKR
jgi:hypothetical protein